MLKCFCILTVQHASHLSLYWKLEAERRQPLGKAWQWGQLWAARASAAPQGLLGQQSELAPWALSALPGLPEKLVDLKALEKL